MNYGQVNFPFLLHSQDTFCSCWLMPLDPSCWTHKKTTSKLIPHRLIPTPSDLLVGYFLSLRHWKMASTTMIFRYSAHAIMHASMILCCHTP